MERKTNTNGTEPNEPATPTAMNEAVEETGTAPPRKGAQARRYLGSGVRFTRHLLEMVVAMFAGMAVLGVAIVVLDRRADAPLADRFGRHYRGPDRLRHGPGRRYSGPFAAHRRHGARLPRPWTGAGSRG